MTDTLSKRHEDYENTYNLTITKRLPIIIKIDGRNFKKLTRNLDKPFSQPLSEIMAGTMMYVITEIQDAIFGYQFSDEINIVLRNDKELDYEPWYNNNIQTIVSTVASLSSIGFNKNLKLLDPDLKIEGDPVFRAKIWPLPNISEVVNYLINKQLLCRNDALLISARIELEKRFGRETAFRELKGTTFNEKKNMLLKHCGLDFEDFYTSSHRKGIAAYKSPTIMPTKDGGITRNRWILNEKLPSFVDDRDFLFNILSSGADVFRESSILR